MHPRFIKNEEKWIEDQHNNSCNLEKNKKTSQYRIIE